LAILKFSHQCNDMIFNYLPTKKTQKTQNLGNFINLAVFIV
jgi:hypothetical protein